MEANIYQAPEADLSTPEMENAQFYVVSSKKFLILFFSTMGMYEIYWYYKNWKAYSAYSNENIMPFWRAVFSIFFTHALFREFNKKATAEDSSHKFKHSGLATLYVILTIASNAFERMATKGIGLPYSNIAGYLILLFLGLIFFNAQKTANLASGDPEGENNNSFSPANFLWIVIGLCLWAILIASYIMPEHF